MVNCTQNDDNHTGNMKHKMIGIESILAAGESDTVEFKSSFDREAIETLAAFANAGMVERVIGAMRAKSQATI